MSVHFKTGRSANSVAKESNDLAKVLPESNQKSHDQTEKRHEMFKRVMEIKKFSPAGNRTPVSRVIGRDTHHYTTEDLAK